MSRKNREKRAEAGTAAPEELRNLFKRLGLAYSKLAVYDPAYKDKMKVTWQRYLESNRPPGDRYLVEIRKSVS